MSALDAAVLTSPRSFGLSAPFVAINLLSHSDRAHQKRGGKKHNWSSVAISARDAIETPRRPSWDSPFLEFGKTFGIWRKRSQQNAVDFALLSLSSIVAATTFRVSDGREGVDRVPREDGHRSGLYSLADHGCWLSLCRVAEGPVLHYSAELSQEVITSFSLSVQDEEREESQTA